MSLVCDAVSEQYAEGTLLTGGLLNFAESGIAGRPFTMSVWVNPGSLSGNAYLFSLTSPSSGLNRLVVERVGADIRQSEWVGGAVFCPQISGLVVDEWSLVVASFAANASRKAWLDAVSATETTNVADFPMTSKLTLGRRSSGNTVGDYADVKFAHLAVYRGLFMDANQASLLDGASPLSIPGCTDYWPLASNYTNEIGAIVLAGGAGAQAPMFDVSDQPEVDAWPPVAGGGAKVIQGAPLVFA
jgi:hypothetical protein